MTATLVTGVLSTISAVILLLLTSFFMVVSICLLEDLFPDQEQCYSYSSLTSLSLALGGVMLVAGLLSSFLTCQTLCCGSKGPEARVSYTTGGWSNVDLS